MSNRSYNIAVLPGDGTGPEVVREGMKVLDAAASKFGFTLNYQNYDFGGDRYLRTGEILPDSALEEFKKYHSIFLGAIGHPEVKPGVLEVGILLKSRFALDQYINGSQKTKAFSCLINFKRPRTNHKSQKFTCRHDFGLMIGIWSIEVLRFLKLMMFRSKFYLSTPRSLEK